MAIKFSNNGLSTLAGALTSGATSLNVASGEGARFPTLSGSDYFMTTLVKLVAGVATLEIVKVTARAGDVFTIVRGQEGTTATTFSAGDRVEHRLTAASLDELNYPRLGANNTYTADQIMSAASIVEAEGADVASAATTDIWAATDGNTKHITGNVTITSLGTAPQAGAWMKLIFDGTPVLTQSANLNVNNGGSNITMEAGDVALVYADTTTQFDVFIIRKSGQPIAASSVGDHEVVAHTGNGHGSTNTNIRRFTTVMTNVGTAITYADSAANGASFTINETGLYSLHYSETDNAAVVFGASLNSAQLTTSIALIAVANRMMFAQTDSGNPNESCSRVVRLVAGDIIRPHTSGNASSTDNKTLFAIRKVGT